MLLLCYITLKSFIYFSISHNCVNVTVTYVMPPSSFLTCVTITCDITLYLLSKPKIKRSKIKLKIKRKK